MRFLFFTGGWILGGMETAFLSLMKGLAARGHEPTAIVSGCAVRTRPVCFVSSPRAWMSRKGSTKSVPETQT